VITLSVDNVNDMSVTEMTTDSVGNVVVPSDGALASLVISIQFRFFVLY